MFAAPALADVKLMYVTADSHRGSAQVYVQDGRVRLENPRESRSVIIYESDKHRFLILDAADKTFRVVDQRAVDDLRRMIARVQGAMSALPDSIRGMINNHAPSVSALLKHPLPQIAIAATGATVRAGDYTCRTLTISVNGGIGYGLCVVPAGKLGIPADDARTLMKMGKDLRRLSGRNLTLKQQAQTLLLEDVGVPVKYVDFRREQTALLNAVGHDDLPERLTAVPPDYEQRALVDVF
ncbi:MAG TPA: hypothetical protein VFK45_08750 [Gammaproteobacteria bacterium]|nr:hypothetical protein [Gammaproteobacteria bacterium]